MNLINWSLIKSPLNWFTILLMVAIAGIAVHLICDAYGINPKVPPVDPTQNPPEANSGS